VTGDVGAGAKVLVAGDTCVGPGALPRNVGSPPWLVFREDLREHDLALVNVECPLTYRPPCLGKSGPCLTGDPVLARLLSAGGFHVATLANNHVLDAGSDGLRDTIAACSDAGLAVVGAGMSLDAAETPLSQTLGGVRIAILACAEREFSIAGARTPGAAPLDPWRTPVLVRQAAAVSDVVLVILHGGNEHYPLPRPGLVAVCRALVDAGAHAVICHHSHVAGPVEVYQGAPIAYGTGNFLFPSDSPRKSAWHLGYLVSLRLTVQGVMAFELLPYQQSVNGVDVQRMGDADEEAFLVRLQEDARVVADPEALASAWEHYCLKQRSYYLYATLGLTRIERRLLRSGVWPVWRRRRRRIPELLNLLTCDSHREAAETIFSREKWS